MLRKNLNSEGGSRHGKRAHCFRTSPLRALFSALTFVALSPVGLTAQTTSPNAPPAQVPLYGSGIQTPLQFRGEAAAPNQVFFSMGISALYDDNVLATNSIRLADEALSIDCSLGITRQTERLRVNFDYMPFFLFYRRLDQYDRLNHAANLNLTYRLTSRIMLGLYDAGSYQSGAYPALTDQQIMSGLASPTALNQMALPYTTRTLSNMAGLDLTFMKSQRTMLTLSGGYNQVKYGSQIEGQGRLYNGSGMSGSLQFQYRVTEHTSFGILLLHQDTTYLGGQVFGDRLRTQMESAFLSVGSRLSPTVTVTIFGGPQYIRTIGLVSAGTGLAAHFWPSGGGNVTKQVRKTAFDLSAQRMISGSGGVYASAIYTSATFGVRRRLVGRWEAGCHGGAARADASLFQLVNGRTDSLIGGINLTRPLSHGCVFHISYGTMHQLNKGTLPIFDNFDRNQVAVGIDYKLKALPLGR